MPELKYQIQCKVRVLEKTLREILLTIGENQPIIGIGQISDENSFELYASIAIVARVIQVGQDLLSAFLVPGIVGLYFNRSRSP